MFIFLCVIFPSFILSVCITACTFVTWSVNQSTNQSDWYVHVCVCVCVCVCLPLVNRFGSFQICKGPDRETGHEGPSAGRPDIIRQLADYVIRNFYPQVYQLNS